MALRTLICGQVNALQYRCRNRDPAVRTMSATSKGGRIMIDVPGLELKWDSESGVDRVGSSSFPDDAATDVGRESCLPIARDPSTAGWFEDPFRPPTTLWRMNAGKCVDQSFA